MLKSKISITLGTVFVVVGMGALVEKAWADGSISLSGLVPAINTASLIWQNPNIGLGALTTGGTTNQSVIGALQVYSNDPTGFVINTISTNGGFLKGTTVTTKHVSYTVALFDTLAHATAGTGFLTFASVGGTGGHDSAYTTALTTATAIFTSGTLTLVVDTGAAPYFLGLQTLAADVSNLMADTYTDTLTISIAEI